MQLLPGWAERLASAAPARVRERIRYALPKATDYYAWQTTFVDRAGAAMDMVDLARQRPLSHISLDAEFRYDRPGVVIDRRHIAHDARSIRPLLLGVSMAEPEGAGGGRLYTFALDLRRSELLPLLRILLGIPIRFVGHFLKSEFFCLWKLGLPEPNILWDTCEHERALYLGRNHKKYKLLPGADEADQARIGEQAEEEDTFGYSLVATCQRYGVAYSFVADKERLQRSFLDHPEDAPFSGEQVQYVAADAIAAARLYPLQVCRAARAGILHHLDIVEMPWVATNARMAWCGLRVDPEKCRLVAAACTEHLTKLEPQLAAHGIANIRSHQQLTKFFGKLGLLHLFQRRGKLSFDKDLLDDFKDRHLAIPLIRAARRVHDLLKEKILTGEFIGADGRVHPDYRQLGTHTGRQTCRWPNVLGLGRLFRPLVVPEAGRGIGEADWSQIEVGIAAAVYQDDRLVEMFNSGDVYSAMAQYFYRDQLSEADRTLPGREFKKKFGQFRNRMKRCTLGIIYRLTPYGLALYLGTSRAEARALLEKFLSMFPALEQALAETVAFGGLCGYASTVTGLRRHRAGHGQLSNWERNWMTNHPVQGSAAVVFKAAGNRLDKLYRRYDAWLIVPLHDAFVFEGPLDVLQQVAELTDRLMCQTVEEFFPDLQARVEVNIQQPECWNKDGYADSIMRWMQDPLYSLD